MKKIISTVVGLSLIVGCSSYEPKGGRKVSSMSFKSFRCENGTQNIQSAQNVIPVGDNLYYPIETRTPPEIAFGDEYKNKRPRHRRGVLRPHAVFVSNTPLKVRAIHSGEITRMGIWQGRTISVTIESPDGHLTRYGGIDPTSVEFKTGDWVGAGDVFALTRSILPSGRATPDLYLEVFSGDAQGGLTTQTGNYCFNRRLDILDTKEWLRKLEALTFEPRDI